jgi:hypothetical protein
LKNRIQIQAEFFRIGNTDICLDLRRNPVDENASLTKCRIFHVQNFTLDELIPAKINFVMNAFNNSEAIAKVGYPHLHNTQFSFRSDCANLYVM